MRVDAAPASVERLNPVFEVRGESVSIMTQFMAAVPRAELGSVVASLNHRSDVIFAAIDSVYHGW